MIFPGGLQFQAISEKKPGKSSGSLGFEPMPPRYQMGATAKYALKPQVQGTRQFSEGSFFGINI